MQDFNENWLVEVRGAIYVADFAELKQWIEEGALLPSDKVRRGNLCWLAAENAPGLCDFFNARDLDTDLAPSPRSESAALAEVDLPARSAFEDSAANDLEWTAEKNCWLHQITEAAFACDLCRKSFCRNCPKSYGGSVKLCPLCDALCRPVDEPVKINQPIGAVNQPYLRIDKDIDRSDAANRSEFHRGDFAGALAYSRKCLKSAYWAAKLFIFSHFEKTRHSQ